MSDTHDSLSWKPLELFLFFLQINDFHVSLKKLEIGIVKNKSKAHYWSDNGWKGIAHIKGRVTLNYIYTVPLKL